MKLNYKHFYNMTLLIEWSNSNKSINVINVFYDPNGSMGDHYTIVYS